MNLKNELLCTDQQSAFITENINNNNNSANHGNAKELSLHATFCSKLVNLGDVL